MLQVVRTDLNFGVAGLLTLVLWTGIPCAQSAERLSGAIRVPEGKFLPQYGPGGSKKPVLISGFMLDPYPVTQAQFFEFVGHHPEWAKGKVSPLFAENRYLGDWVGTSKRARPAETRQKLPVIYVSYFAAASFCEAAGGRLPTTLEWEYVAQESIEAQMTWLSNPKPPSPVGRGKPNRHGIYDLYGQVWEWTADYNSSFATEDSRQNGELDKNLFCGAGAMNARDREHYPAFMRYAMRSGLMPYYTIANLGMRCAYDLR